MTTATKPMRRVSTTGKPMNKTAQPKGHGPSDIPGNLGRPIPNRRSAQIVKTPPSQADKPPSEAKATHAQVAAQHRARAAAAKADMAEHKLAEAKAKTTGTDGQPIPTKSVAKKTSVGGVAKATAIGRVGRGIGNIGKSAGPGTDTGPIVPIMFLVFAVIAIAKVRGKANIDVKHAVFGGFLVTFVLLGMYRMNSTLGTAFAVVILLTTLLEYGTAALGGGFANGSDYSAKSLVSGINENVPKGLEGAIGGDINSHSDSLPKNQGGISSLPTHIG